MRLAGFTSEQKALPRACQATGSRARYQIYRAYLKEAEQIERLGARIFALSSIFELNETSTRQCTLLGNLNLSAIAEIKQEVPNASIVPYIR